MKHTVRFKSTPDNFEKEKSGRKSNTVRNFRDYEYDPRERVLKDFMRGRCELAIEIENTETYEVFLRVVTDVTWWQGFYIISWRPVC